MIVPVCLTCIGFCANADLHKGACDVMAEDVYATNIACPYYIWKGGDVMDDHMTVVDFSDFETQVQADEEDYENINDISFSEMVARCGYRHKLSYDLEEISWILDIDLDSLNDEVASGRLKLTTEVRNVVKVDDIDRWMKEN